MKNIITILLILILPVAAYFILSSKSNDKSAYAIDKNHPAMLIFT